MTNPSSGHSMGRPREFTQEVALRTALMVFWRQGYAATSLDDLTTAMGLSRSSFYGAFGSKHDVLLAAVRHYVDEIYATLQSVAGSSSDPMDGLQGIVEALTNPHGNDEGCLLVNSIAELAPSDHQVCQIAQTHVARVLALIGDLLVKAGHLEEAAEQVAGAVLSFTFGANTLRKAGLSGETLVTFMMQAERLLVTQR